jgi:hypothetical protein
LSLTRVRRAELEAELERAPAPEVKRAEEAKEPKDQVAKATMTRPLDKAVLTTPMRRRRAGRIDLAIRMAVL